MAEPDPVPYARFQEKNDQLQVALAQIETLKPQAARVATLEQQIATQATKLAEIETLRPQAARATALEVQLAAKSEEAAIYQVGVTDAEAITVARALHATLPAEGRPELPAWLAAQKAAPATAPRALAPYLGQPAAAAPPPPAGAPPAPAAAPKPPAPSPAAGGALPGAPPAGADVSAAQLAAARGTPQGHATMNAWRISKGLAPKPEPAKS